MGGLLAGHAFIFIHGEMYGSGETSVTHQKSICEPRIQVAFASADFTIIGMILAKYQGLFK